MLEGGIDAHWRPLVWWMGSIIVAGWLGLSGCSSFHEVTVVGHGVEDSEPSPVTVSNDIPASIPDPASLPKNAALAPTDSLPSPTQKPVPEEPAMEEVTTDIMAQSVEEASLPWTMEDVFFEFDQYVIQPEAIRILELNAKVLKERYSDRELILEGHCDERGTEEYNLILGERRATAVKNFLKDLGVPPANLRVLSLGKLQPFCLARTGECFRKNRRVHFVFK